MARRPGPGLLAVSAAAVVALMSPFSPLTVLSAGAEEKGPAAGDVSFLNVRGRANRVPNTSPERMAYVLDVYDSANKKIGTVIHDSAFTSATTAEIISTFRLPDGDLVNRATEAFAPDSSRPNYYLTGIHPEGATVQGDKSTGAYAGRTGRLRMSGWHDAGNFPAVLAVNDFYAIELNPKP